MDHLSSANLFSEMEMVDAAFVNEWMGTLDNFVQSYPNNPFLPPASTDNNGFDRIQNSGDVLQKPVTMNTVQRQPSASSSSNSFISFANSDGGFENPKAAPVMKMKTEMDNPSGKTMMSFMPSQDCADHDNDERRRNLIRTIEFGAGKRGSAIRSPLQAQDHVLAERKRRQKLTQHFISLSALIPSLKKLDKASVLGDAIKYIKELQERVRTLEVDQEQAKRSGDKESTAAVKGERVSGNDEDSSSLSDDGSYGAGTAVALPEIEVRASGENLLIRVHCNKLRNHGALVTEIFSEIERLHLSINTSHVMPFGNATYITVAAQMNHGFSLEAKDVADNIRTTIVKLICHGHGESR